MCSARCSTTKVRGKQVRLDGPPSRVSHRIALNDRHQWIQVSCLVDLSTDDFYLPCTQSATEAKLHKTMSMAFYQLDFYYRIAPNLYISMRHSCLSKVGGHLVDLSLLSSVHYKLPYNTSPKTILNTSPSIELSQRRTPCRY
jgi:hypothetical protein